MNISLNSTRLTQLLIVAVFASSFIGGFFGFAPEAEAQVGQWRQVNAELYCGENPQDLDFPSDDPALTQPCTVGDKTQISGQRSGGRSSQCRTPDVDLANYFFECFPVDTDCEGSWSSYGSCSASCGGGTETRTYNVSVPQSGNGDACPFADGATQSQPCNTQQCATPVDCQGSWSNYGSCSASCGGGTETRTYTITQAAQNGGQSCPYNDGQTQSQPCNTQACATPVNCAGYWSAGACSAQCGSGTRTETFTVTTAPANGGAACPASPRTVSCTGTNCPSADVNCAGYWSAGACSAQCGSGTRTETFIVTTQPQGNGAACPASPRTVSCTGTNCPAADVDCQGYWSDTSTCSAQCGSGTKSQEFIVTTPPSGNGAACPASPRTVSCTGNNCPLPDPNLSFAAYRAVSSGVINPVTGNYTSATVEFVPRNTESTAINTPSTYRVQGGGDTQTGTINSVPANSDGSVVLATFNDVSPGQFDTTITLDLNDDISETNESDNTVTFSTTFALPDPTLSISADPALVRSDETVDLAWDATAAYPMECRVEGPTIDPTITDNTAPYGGTTSVGPLSAKSIFMITCREPNSGTEWSEDVTVEVLGTVEEI